MAITYEPIQTITASGSSAVIDFQSIPATYTDLRLIIVGNASSTGVMQLRFNADSNQNYNNLYINGAGTLTAGFLSSQTAIYSGINFYDNQNSTPSSFMCDILDYTSSYFKGVSGNLQSIWSSNGEMGWFQACWRNSAVINRIQCSLNFNNWNFSNTTTATLYGIKAA